MQIECAYCGRLTACIPKCSGPYCPDCCEKCKLENGECKEDNSNEKTAD